MLACQASVSQSGQSSVRLPVANKLRRLAILFRVSLYWSLAELLSADESDYQLSLKTLPPMSGTGSRLFHSPHGGVKGKKGKSEHLYSALHGTNHSKALRHGSHSF